MIRRFLRSAGPIKLGKIIGIAVCVLCVPVIQGCAGVVAAGAAAGAMAQDRRTPGTYIDDQLIERRMLAAMRKDEALWSRIHVNATSVNGRVLLTGEATGESLRSRIDTIAREVGREVPGIRDTRNRVVIAAPSSLLSRSNDSLVTSKVKTALFGNRDLNLKALHVKVVTERGTVYLMGLLKRDEADRATEIARRIGGVRRVVQFMEYVE